MSESGLEFNGHEFKVSSDKQTLTYIILNLKRYWKMVSKCLFERHWNPFHIHILYYLIKEQYC